MKNRIGKKILDNLGVVVLLIIIFIFVILVFPFILFRTFWFWITTDESFVDCYRSAWSA